MHRINSVGKAGFVIKYNNYILYIIYIYIIVCNIVYAWKS